MNTHDPQPFHARCGVASPLAHTLLACATLAPLLVLNRAAAADPKFCTATAQQQLAACQYDRRDNLHVARAACLNLSSDAARAACYADADDAYAEEGDDCDEQHEARLALCGLLGEARYEPVITPTAFDSDFRHLTRPNAYLPLGIGYRWRYAGGDETVDVVVLDRTKRIVGLSCIVVSDRVSIKGQVIEDTFDWYAQAKNGDVHYCGEDTREFETFAGDRPVLPELVNIDGAFKWGRDGAKGGIAFLGVPRVGKVYRQELKLGEAEDAAIVLATNYRYLRYPGLDRHVPRALMERLCNAGDCVVTAEATPLEPGVVERKYYAAGIGNIATVNLETGEASQLVGCNFDARCIGLPAP